MVRFVSTAVIGVALVASGGCGDDGGAERVPLQGPEGTVPQGPEGMGSEAAGEGVSDLPSELQEGLDAGNAAYRAGEYEAALRHFTEVVEQDPRLAAAWYGVGMTESALGNREAADSAMAAAHRLAPHIPLEHPGTAAPANPHPSPPASGSGEPY